MKRASLLSFTALATAQAANAQVATNITPDTAAATALGTTVTHAGTTHVVDGGTLKGTNLFHSFQAFDLAKGETAQWVYTAGNPTEITNVVNRVTGGTPSSIFGLLDSTAIPNADFYFINPAGIVFGEGAQVNVPAAAHFSTASDLRFADGKTMSIATSSGSTLSVAAPEAFGFLGNEGDILVAGAGNDPADPRPFGSPSGSLDFSAANIDFDSAHTQSNGLTLAAVGARAAHIAVSGPTGALSGDLSIRQSELTSENGGSEAGAPIRVAAGNIFATNGQLVTDARSTGSSGSIDVWADTVSLYGGSAITAQTLGTGAGGSINLVVSGQLQVLDSAITATSGDRDNPVRSTADAGAIAISAGSLDVYNSLIEVDAFDEGDGGDLRINVAGDAEVGISEIASNAWFHGKGGSVLVDVGGTFWLNDAAISSRAGIRAFLTAAPGRGGDVTVSASALHMGGSLIQSNARGEADGGTVTVDVENDLTMFLSSVSSRSFGSGSAGTIDISATDADLFNSLITSDASATGDGGSINVQIAGDLNLDSSTISSSTGDPSFFDSGSGTAGDVSITADNLVMTNLSQIQSIAQRDGEGGTVAIDIGSGIIDGSGIQANSSGVGNAGDLTITAGTLAILDSALVQSTAYGNGAGGNVKITAETLNVAGNSLVGADSLGAGDAGDVRIEAGDLLLDDGAIVASRSAGSGNGGGVQIATDSLEMSRTSWIMSNSFGTGNAGHVDIDSDAIDVSQSSILSAANGDGDGGSVDIASDTMTLSQSSIQSAAYGLGNGGIVNIGANDLQLLDASSIESSAFGAGNAGDINIAVPDLLEISDGSLISSNSGSNAPESLGRAGSISVEAGHLLIDAGFITSTAQAGGESGTINLVADKLDFSVGSIGSNSLTGNAGSVQIAANAATLDFGTISSDAFGGGNGGDVVLSIRGGLDLTDFSISTHAASDFNADEAGNGGDISIEAATMSMLRSQIGSSALGQGDGGNISIQIGAYLSLEDSSIYTDTLGAGVGGNISINAGEASLVLSRITADSNGEGLGGFISLNIDADLSATGQSYISADSLGSGDAGDIDIAVGSLHFDDDAYISSDALGEGHAGFTSVAATGELALTGGAYISSDSVDVGDAGDVLVTAGRLFLDDGSISSDAYGSGNGGFTEVDADNIEMRGDSYISADALGDGEGGDLEVNAGSIHITGPANITADAKGEGDSGFVDITADRLDVDGAALISSSSFGAGIAGGVFITVGKLTLNDSSIVSDSFASGDAGNVEITAGSIQLTGDASISTDAKGNGNSGFVDLTADVLNLDNGATISSSSFGDGDAGGVFVDKAGDVTLHDSSIVSDAHASGNAGGVFFLAVNNLTLDSSILRSEAASTGFGGSIEIDATGEVSLLSSAIATNANGTGDAGDIEIEAGSLSMTEASSISSDALSTLGGESGFVTLAARDVAIQDASRISTGSANDNPAGYIQVAANSLLVNGHATSISSENTSEPGGDAGSISIAASNATISEGGRVTTNSLNGAAGDINFAMPATGILTLIGANEPGVIETSSGPGTGGIITIGTPLAIISHGGVISALGDAGGANVRIDTPYFIASSDRLNIVAVNGSLTFSNGIYDVSAGTSDVDLSMLDASSVLQGQCSSVHATGRVSQLNIRPSGPFASSDWSAIEPAKAGAGAGACQ